MSDAAREAGRRYQDALDALHDQRKQIAEDLEFSDPSNPQQWDADEKRQREMDPGGARPCLVLDQTGQYISNVAGQVEQRPPALHAIPAGDGADRRVAEQLDGFFRHIEHTSRAQQHYARALTSAARAGVGYLIVRPEYVDRALGYQEPRISSEGDPLRVVFDPWSVELDGSDANMGYLVTPLSHAEFERQFGLKTAKVSFGDTQQSTVSDDRESVLVAEEWRVDMRTRNVIVFRDLSGDEVALPEDQFHEAHQRQQVAEYLRSYSDKQRVVLWSRMSGAEVLSKEVEYPASGIGIVPMYGYVGWSGGRMTYCGIPRRARSAQQAYNYHASEIRALQSQAAKAPWMIPTRAFGGSAQTKQIWDRASVESRAFLPYEDMDDEGRPIAPPQRVQPSVNLQNHIAGLMQAREDVQASIGMYQASLGAPSNESSGIAIESRKAQGEASTAHFPSHLAASLGQVGKLCMEMIPRLVDTPRQARILGIDQTPGSVRIDPTQAEALSEDEETGALTINPNVGRYDVRVVVGASFSTQRQQAQQAYTEMMRANPAMMPAIAPLWAQTLDVPHADKLAQVLTAMAPDPVKSILQPDKAPSTAQMQAHLQQTQQAMQEAVQVAQQAQDEIAELHAELERVKAAADAKEDETAIKAYDAQTKRLQVLGTTLTPEAVQQIAAQTALAALQQPMPTDEPCDMPEPDAMPAEPMAPEMPPQQAQPPAHDPHVLAGALHAIAGSNAAIAEALRRSHGPKRVTYDPMGNPTGIEPADEEFPQ